MKSPKVRRAPGYSVKGTPFKISFPAMIPRPATPVAPPIAPVVIKAPVAPADYKNAKRLPDWTKPILDCQAAAPEAAATPEVEKPASVAAIAPPETMVPITKTPDPAAVHIWLDVGLPYLVLK